MPRNDEILLENVKILFRNFRGLEGPYNKLGDRNFCIILPDPDIATGMAEAGWNIKTTREREEDGEITPGLPYIEMKLGYNPKAKPPLVVMVTDRGRTNLGEHEVDLLDFADIVNTDIIFAPHYWENGAKHGLKAYVRSVYFTIEEDALARKYARQDEARKREHHEEGPPFDE